MPSNQQQLLLHAIFDQGHECSTHCIDGAHAYRFLIGLDCSAQQLEEYCHAWAAKFGLRITAASLPAPEADMPQWRAQMRTCYDSDTDTVTQGQDQAPADAVPYLVLVRRIEP